MILASSKREDRNKNYIFFLNNIRVKGKTDQSGGDKLCYL